MRDPARREYEVARAGPVLLFADLENVLALEHVEELVLVLVEVKRRVDGLPLLEDRVGAAGRVAGDLDQDLDLAEPQPLTAARFELERRSVSHAASMTATEVGLRAPHAALWSAWLMATAERMTAERYCEMTVEGDRKQLVDGRIVATEPRTIHAVLQVRGL